METQAVANSTPSTTGNVGSTSKPSLEQGSGTKAGKSSNDDGKAFLSTLEKALASDQEASVDASTTQLSLMMLLSAVNPLWQQTTASTENPDSIDGMAKTLLKALEPGLSDAKIQLILNDPALINWLAQAKEVFAALSDATQVKNPDSNNVVQSSMMAMPILPTENSPQQVQNVILQVLAALKEDPSNPKLMKLADDLQSTLKPLLTLLGDNKFQLHLAENETSQPLAKDERGKSVKSEENVLLRTHLRPMNMKVNFHSVLPAVAAAPAAYAAPSQAKSILQLTQTVPVATLQLQPSNTVPLAQDTQPTEKLDAAAALPLAVQDIAKTVNVEQAAKALPPPMNAQYFAQEMTRFIMKGMKLTTSNGFSEARISLIPENLGQVDVRITMHNGQLVAHFMTETLLGKESLDNQLSQLRTALNSQGIQVDKLEVTQNSSLQSNMFQGQKQQQSSQQYHQLNKGNSSDYDQINDNFALELEHISTAKKSIYGNSFNVSA